MTTRCRICLLFLPLALAVAACSGGGGGSTPTSPLAPSTEQVELRSFSYVNDARSENGIDPQLELRELISNVAREHSEAMRDEGSFGHHDSLGREVGERLADAGVSFHIAAENLARVTNSPTPAAWVHEHLMASDEHRPNILNPSVELMGVGVATDGSTYWFTQIFVGR